MNIFAIISTVLASVIVFWAVYHACIIIAGVRSRGKFEGKEGFVGGELPRISLIVPARNDSLVIGRCLDSLLNMDYPREKMQIIVVVGDSTDSTASICEQYESLQKGVLELIRESTSSGKPAALNLALSKINGDIVGLFDADSVPHSNVLLKVASYFDDPAVNAIQGSGVSLNEDQNMITRVAAAEDKAWFQGLLRGREKLNLFVAFTGSCQFIRTSVLRGIGGWIESALAEDLDLSLRLLKNQVNVRFAPDVSSGQETPFSLKGLVTQRMRWYRGYMDASLKYGNLFHKKNRRVIDAELSLVGPFIMVVCLAGFVNWGVSLLFLPIVQDLFSAGLVVVLNCISLLPLGVSLTLMVKPMKIRNVLLIPFIYLYWLMQMAIAFLAFLNFVFNRTQNWKKTIKSGVVKRQLQVDFQSRA
jgi:cellulose synthase/poly-beta-1,6-N-acetylglucosamine synthase-like glycosyltransferase